MQNAKVDDCTSCNRIFGVIDLASMVKSRYHKE